MAFENLFDPPENPPVPAQDQSGLMNTANQSADNYYQQAQEVGPNSYQTSAPVAQVSTREADPNQMAGYQMNELTDPNSAWGRRAQQEGADWAASRGLMNTSIGAGASYGAWIDRAQPLALQQAGAHERAASESMAATNIGAQQQADRELQAQLTGEGYDFQRDAAIRDYWLGASEDQRRAALNIEAREDTQAWTTAERLAIEAYQRGERLDTQDWTDEQRQAVERWQTLERLGTQGWTDEQRRAVEAWQRQERLGAEYWQTQERLGGQHHRSLSAW
jgi:hypothetical protein